MTSNHGNDLEHWHLRKVKKPSCRLNCRSWCLKKRDPQSPPKSRQDNPMKINRKWLDPDKDSNTIKMWLERQVHDRKCSYLRRGHRGRKLSKVIVIYVNCQWRECCSLRLRRVWQLFVEWGDDNAVCIEDKLDDCSGVMMYALHSMRCYGWWWPGPQWI